MELFYLEQIEADLPAHVMTDIDGRDPYRTPMQWDGSHYGGFSQSEPWLPLAENKDYTNVDTQSVKNDSILSIYKQLINLRRNHASLREGSYAPGPLFIGGISYWRTAPDGSRCLVAINLSDTAQCIPVGLGQWAMYCFGPGRLRLLM